MAKEDRKKRRAARKAKRAQKKLGIKVTGGAPPPPSKVAPVIKLEPKEKPKLGERIKEVLIGDPLTKGKEDIRAGALPIGPGAAAKATVSASVSAHRLITTGAGAEKLIGIGTRTAVRSFTGRPAVSGIKKLFSVGNRAAATRFATNTKSTSLTTELLKFAKSPVGVIGAIGSYPFAGFIKEEALQTVGMGFFQASQNNDVIGMEMAIKEQEDILDPRTWEKIISTVPYANVVKQLRDYFKAARVKLQIDKGVFEQAKLEAAGAETEFQRNRRISDEAARARVLQFRAEDEAYFNDIEEQREADKEAGRVEDAAYYQDVAEENRARKLKEREEDEAYYAQFT